MTRIAVYGTGGVIDAGVHLPLVDFSGEGFSHLVVTAYAPRCATLGRRVRASTTAGRVVEGGKPVPRTDLYLAGESGNTGLGPKETKTNGAGRFTVRFRTNTKDTI